MTLKSLASVRTTRPRVTRNYRQENNHVHMQGAQQLLLVKYANLHDATTRRRDESLDSKHAPPLASKAKRNSGVHSAQGPCTFSGRRHAPAALLLRTGQRPKVTQAGEASFGCLHLLLLLLNCSSLNIGSEIKSGRITSLRRLPPASGPSSMGPSRF